MWAAGVVNVVSRGLPLLTDDLPFVSPLLRREVLFIGILILFLLMPRKKSGRDHENCTTHTALK